MQNRRNRSTHLWPENDIRAFELAWKEITRSRRWIERLNKWAEKGSKAFVLFGAVLQWFEQTIFKVELIQKVGPGKKSRPQHEWDGSSKNLGPFPLRCL